MADIDPDSIPFLLGKQDAVSDKEGKPTTVFLDWLQGLWGWMKRSVVDLTTKITTVQDETDNAHARITEEITARVEGDEALASKITTIEVAVGDNTAAIIQEATARANADEAIASLITSLTAEVDGNTAAIAAETTARVDGDEALASQITTLSADFDGFTANGQIYFKAMAGPTGSTAAYGIFLTAGDVFTGLMLVAESGGGSHIVMTAGSLEFWDSSSGSQVNMLAYAGGEWVLNGNVTLQAVDGSGATCRWRDGHFGVWDNLGQPVVLFGVNL